MTLAISVASDRYLHLHHGQLVPLPALEKTTCRIDLAVLCPRGSTCLGPNKEYARARKRGG